MLINKDLIRSNLSKYTRKAYKMLPAMDSPCILDIGCGSGVPAIELAKLSNGRITAVDIDQMKLDLLSLKLIENNLQGRIKILKRSICDLNFDSCSFDVIWAEGSINFIGFERGLKEWRRFIKSHGYLVVHDDRCDLENKLKIIKVCRYDLKTHFSLTKNIWWKEYYEPLERKIRELSARSGNDSKTLESLKTEQEEIDMYKKNPGRFESVFFIMQKA